MKKHVPQRIALLQENMSEMGLDAAIIYDRENLIYFAGVDDLEGGVLCVPAKGEAELFCLWLDTAHMKETSGVTKVTPYHFPGMGHSVMAAKWLAGLGIEAPRVGFTRYFISLKDYQSLRAQVPGFVVDDIATLCYRLRSVKCPEEIALMRRASEALAAGMDAAVSFVHPGCLETDVLAEAEYAMRKAGSEGASFRMQVLRHDRQMLMHPYAGGYEIKNNEPVLIHLGASCGGYTSKMCRTVFLGETPEPVRKIYHYLIEAQKIAVDSLRPGVSCGEVFDKVFSYIEGLGYGNKWMEHIGYGVGIRQSEFYPILAKGSDTLLEANMVVDVLLPTIYEPDVGGPRLTDTILITEKGAEYLTEYTREPIHKP